MTYCRLPPLDPPPPAPFPLSKIPESTMAEDTVPDQLDPKGRSYCFFFFVVRWTEMPVALTKAAVFISSDRLVGLVVKASASRAEDPGFESRLRRDFSGSSHTGDSKIGTPESLICNFYLSVAARKIV